MHSNPSTNLASNTNAGLDPNRWPLLICLFGQFNLLNSGQPVPIAWGGKTEAMLSILALRYDHSIPRNQLVTLLWPNTDLELGYQSLYSLVYSLRKRFSAALGGA